MDEFILRMVDILGKRKQKKLQTQRNLAALTAGNGRRLGDISDVLFKLKLTPDCQEEPFPTVITCY